MKKIIITMIISIFLSFNCFAESIEDKTIRINKFVSKLNHGAASTMNDISFSCFNCDDEKPILVMKFTLQCLECNKCAPSIEFLKSSFSLISEIWFKHFGNHRINIVNHVDKLIFIINDDGDLVKPLPLPKEYV